MKQHLQVGTESSLQSTFNYIRLSHGYRGFYIGLPSLLLREIPYSCIQMPIYEGMKLMYTNPHKRFLTLHETVVSGFVAGSIAAFLTNPVDVVKTNIMTQRKLIYTGFWDCAIKLREKNGAGVFTKGINYRVMSVGGVSAFFFLGYEVFMEFFSDKF